MRRFALVGMAALALLGSSVVTISAQDAGDAKAKEGERADATLPTNDPKAELMLKEAWDRVECLATEAKNPLERLAAKTQTKVDSKQVRIPRGMGMDEMAKMLDEILIDSNIAWTKGNVFSIHVHDQGEGQPPAGGGGPGGWMMAGLRPALRGAIVRIGHVLQYTIGYRAFAEEFKGCTFEFVTVDPKAAKAGDKNATADKDARIIRVWRDVLGRPIAHTYFIDKKGKGLVAKVVRDGKAWSFEYTKAKKLQRVTKVTIGPEHPPEPKKEEDKKDDAPGGQGRGGEGGGEGRGPDGRGGGGRGGRGPGGGGGPGGAGRGPGGGGAPAGSDIPAGTEVFTFGERKLVSGFEISTQVTSHFEWRTYRIPIIMTMSDVTVNKDATDELIKAGGFGPSQDMPAPTSTPARTPSGGDGEEPKDGKDGEAGK